jgi:hypothetical protein
MKNLQLFFLLFMSICIAGCATTRKPVHTALTSQKILDSIQEKLRSGMQESELKMTNSVTSGHYSDPGASVKERVGPGLSGSDLYLFPDKTYVYIEWADILPPTIYEKGKWKFENSFIFLEDDGSLTRSEFPTDHIYLPVTILTGSLHREVLLGYEWSYSHFMEHAGDDPEFILFLFTLERENDISIEQADNLKQRLLKESWNPEFFTE